MNNQTNTENKDATTTTVETAAPVVKGPRGYTKHGYPAQWRAHGKTHEDCMVRLNKMIQDGTGSPFNCKALAVPKAKMSADIGAALAAPKTKKGRTKAGYPASYLRGGATHEQAMARWQAKLAALSAQTASNPESPSESVMERSATDSERVLEVAGVKFFFSQDHYNYLLRGSDGGPKRYYGTFGKLLEEVRDRCLKATLHKVGNAEIMRLEDLILADKNVTSALRDFCAKEEDAKNK